jgi:hypothetical protein
VRAALFNFQLPNDFVARYLGQRLDFTHPRSVPSPVEGKRWFWESIMVEEIKAIIKNEGDAIEWYPYNEIAGPEALNAKESLLRALPYILSPETSAGRYRFVLEPEFAVENITIHIGQDGRPRVTSIFDLGRAKIKPAMLVEPIVELSEVGLTVDSRFEPDTTFVSMHATDAKKEEYQEWATQYLAVCLSLPSVSKETSC